MLRSNRSNRAAQCNRTAQYDPSPTSVGLPSIPRVTGSSSTWKLAAFSGPSSDSSYLSGTNFQTYLSNYKALKSIGKVGGHNACAQRRIEFITAFDYTLQHRKGSVNGNADFLSRLSEPAMEHDRSGSSSHTPVNDGGIMLIRAAGFALVLHRRLVPVWVGWCPAAIMLFR